MVKVFQVVFSLWKNLTQHILTVKNHDLKACWNKCRPDFDSPFHWRCFGRCGCFAVRWNPSSSTFSWCLLSSAGRSDSCKREPQSSETNFWKTMSLQIHRFICSSFEVSGLHNANREVVPRLSVKFLPYFSVTCEVTLAKASSKLHRAATVAAPSKTTAQTLAIDIMAWRCRVWHPKMKIN